MQVATEHECLLELLPPFLCNWKEKGTQSIGPRMQPRAAKGQHNLSWAVPSRSMRRAMVHPGSSAAIADTYSHPQ
eukprot:1157717-Pelagomonas_calceolata.AAC.6